MFLRLEYPQNAPPLTGSRGPIKRLVVVRGSSGRRSYASRPHIPRYRTREAVLPRAVTMRFWAAATTLLTVGLVVRSSTLGSL